jgi:signal peptidase I
MEELLRKDWRPPVLFLRPFVHDAVVVARPWSFTQFFIALPWEQVRMVGRLTFEEAITSIFQGVGPVVAIGDPQRGLDVLGAARSFPDTDRWRSMVDDLAERASTIVAIPGVSPGVMWELRHLFARPRACPIVVVVPVHRPKPHETRSVETRDVWEHARRILPSLPELSDRTAAVLYPGTSNGIARDPVVWEGRSSSIVSELAAIKAGVDQVIARPPVLASMSLTALRLMVISAWVLAIPGGLTAFLAHSAEDGSPTQVPFYLGAAIAPLFFAFGVLTLEYLPFSARLGFMRNSHPVRTFQPGRWALKRVLWLTPIALALALRHFVVESFLVPSGSMEPTIAIEERVIASKWDHSYRRGDVVVFRYPMDESVEYAKRIVAVAGDRLRFLAGHLELNGVILPSCRIGSKHFGPTPGFERLEEMAPAAVWQEVLEGHPHLLLKDESGRGADVPMDEVVVPAETVYVLGDNRDNSNDSRAYGPVPVTSIRGKIRWNLSQWRLTDDLSNVPTGVSLERRRCP